MGFPVGLSKGFGMTTQELLGLIEHGADWDDGDREARARRSAWLCFERRRSQVAAGLRHPKLPRNRYEDLQLAADLCRVEGRCLVRPGKAPAPAEQCLITGLKLQLASVQESLERTERWLSLEGRRRATTEAEKRFRTIADEVRAELISRGVVVPSRAKPEPRTAAAHRCEAITRKGARCKNRATAQGVCGVHARVRESAVLPDNTAQHTPSSETGADPVAVSVYVNRLRVLSESLARQPVPVPDFAAIRGWLPSWPDPERIDPRRAWAAAGTLTVAVAAALIWSGLTEDGYNAPGRSVELASPRGLPALPVSRSDLGKVDNATALVARTDRSDAADDRNRNSANRTSRDERDPAIREPGETPDDPTAGPSGSGSSAAPAPAPAPVPAPPPAPAPEPGGGAGSEGPGGSEPEPSPAPSPAPTLSDTVNDVVSGLTETANDVVEQIPLAGGS
jgi:hypothetical protein